MSITIDQYIAENTIIKAIHECLREQQYSLGTFLARIHQSDNTSPEFHRLMVQLYDATVASRDDEREITVEENIIEDNPPLVEESDLNTKHHDSVETNEQKVQETQITEEQKSDNKKVRVMMYCNWCDSKELCESWNKMSKGDYTWNNIQIVWGEPYDWIVIINCPPITVFPDTKRTILFQMEPHMANNKHMWGDWGDPPVDSFKYCGTHANGYNNNEWHLAKTYSELSCEEVLKEEHVASILSTVLSDKYNDPGHVKRVDFVKFLETKGLDVHVFGGNKFTWKNYKGSLPSGSKDDAMLPYKYTFNAENHEIRNYFTEKLIDGILAECLVFYWGCPNIRDFFDERALVILNLDDFEKDFNTIKKAIEENWWADRIDIIRKEKQRILNYYQFFPRLERIINNDE